MERITKILRGGNDKAVDAALRQLFKDDSDFSVSLVEQDSLSCTYVVEQTCGLLYDMCLIMIDAHTDSELADEERFMDEDPLWFTDKSHRVSPIYRLMEIAKRRDCQFCKCFYLTRGSICNYEDMMEVWDELRCKVCVNAYIDSLELRPDVTPEMLPPYTPAPSLDNIASLPCDLSSEDDEPKAPVERDVINIYLDPDTGEYVVSSRDSTPMSPDGFVEWILEDLNKMKGLDCFKDAMREFAEFVVYDELAKDVNGGVSPHPDRISTSAVFVGNPGTGKTTVAKIYGKILYNLGLLNSPEFKMVSRDDIINKPYYGTEEQNIRRLIEDMRARKGGVLFVDEAYSLSPAHDPKDPGHLVITGLMGIMDRHPDIAVVFAGYPDDMERFLNTNHGLKSRLEGRIFHFDDYDVDTLLDIAVSKLQSHNYKLTPTALSWIGQHIEDAYMDRDKYFGNGRFIDKLVERIFTIHARRIVHRGVYIPDEIMVINADDIPIYESKNKDGIIF